MFLVLMLHASVFHRSCTLGYCKCQTVLCHASPALVLLWMCTCLFAFVLTVQVFFQQDKLKLYVSFSYAEWPSSVPCMRQWRMSYREQKTRNKAEVGRTEAEVEQKRRVALMQLCRWRATNSTNADQQAVIQLTPTWPVVSAESTRRRNETWLRWHCQTLASVGCGARSCGDC